MIPWLLLACSSPGPDDSAVPVDDTALAQDDTAADDTAADDTAPVDEDGDGYNVTEDCDDASADVHPGAVETWNEVDDDCDGRADADGDYTGDHALAATAIYKGTPYSWDLVCPTTLSRQDGVLAFVVTCTPDPDDAMAMLMLGETLTVEGEDTEVTGPGWSGRSDLVSSTGWDTRLEATLTWQDFDNTALVTLLSTVSLETAGSGNLARTGR